VPKLATKILTWLDVHEDDVILDVGCGDGILNLQIAETLAKGSGRIHGIDSSVDMITNAQKAASSSLGISKICTFEVLDATSLTSYPALQTASFDKVFSNAAMHWILRPPQTRTAFFHGIHSALRPSGLFCFEMGGFGNVAEIRTAFISVIGRRIGVEKAREVDPWFFPDQEWIRRMLEDEVGGFKVEKSELEHRPTKADKGGLEGWLDLMGKQFFDAVEGGGEREKCKREVAEILKSICESPSGDGVWMGYVRLRVLARKI